MTNKSHQNPTNARLARVLDYIYDNVDADLSLDTLADVAALSRFHFHRIFRAVNGETVAQAVRRVRLNKAAHLLVKGEDPIGDVARQCGYANIDSFNRAFTTVFGMRPVGFRARRKLVLSHSPDPDRRTHTMSYPTEIKTLPAYRMATLDHLGPYNEIGRAFEALAMMMTTGNLWAQADKMCGIYFDDPYTVPEAELRSKACVIISEDMQLIEPMVEYRTAAGEHAVLTYTGPYSGLPTVYDWLYSEWLPASGRQPADSPCWEKNLNDPQDTAPSDLITEIHLPLRPAAAG